jgi:hypothetical protein
MVPGTSAPLQSFRIDTVRTESSGMRFRMRCASFTMETGVITRSRNLPTTVGMEWSTYARRGKTANERATREGFERAQRASVQPRAPRCEASPIRASVAAHAAPAHVAGVAAPGARAARRSAPAGGGSRVP